MDRPGQLFRQDGVDAALALDATLAGKARRDNFEAEMRFLAALGARVVVAGMKVRIVINSEA